MTPKPPIWTPRSITPWPNPDQYESVGTVARPVTHTAEVAVNKASANGARCPDEVAIGVLRSPVNTTMTLANTARVSRAGEWRATRSMNSRAAQKGPDSFEVTVAA